MKLARHPHLFSRLCLWLAAAIIADGLPGCLDMNNNKAIISGNPITAAEFARIKPGQSKDFVVGLLRSPTEIVNEDGGSELWKWHYSKHQVVDGSLFPVNRNEINIEQTHDVEFKDGVVTNTWSE